MAIMEPPTKVRSTSYLILTIGALLAFAVLVGLGNVLDEEPLQIRIAVVDDAGIFRANMVQYLPNHLPGVVVETYATCGGLITRLQAEPQLNYHVYVVDFLLDLDQDPLISRGDGCTMAVLRERPGAIIVGSSSYRDERTKQVFMEAGAKAFISKITLKEYAVLIKQLLDLP